MTQPTRDAQHTPWFKRGTRPRRTGVYRVRYNVAIGMNPAIRVTGYSYWSRRKGWCQRCHTPNEALRRNHYELGRIDWTTSAARIQPEWQGRTK